MNISNKKIDIKLIYEIKIGYKYKYPIYSVDEFLKIEIKNDFFYKKINNELIKFNFGTIFYVDRPDKLYLSRHYFFFVGFINNIIYVAHNDKKGVRVVSMYDVLKEREKFEYSIIETNSEKSEIIKRLIEIKDKKYNAISFNCQHFVNYCVFGKNISLIKDTYFTIYTIFEAFISMSKNKIIESRHKKMTKKLIKIINE